MIPEVTVRTLVIESGWIFPDSELTNNREETIMLPIELNAAARSGSEFADRIMLNLALHAIAQRHSLEEFKSCIRVCADNAAVFPDEVSLHWPEMPGYSPRHHDLFRRAFLASFEYLTSNIMDFGEGSQDPDHEQLTRILRKSGFHVGG